MAANEPNKLNPTVVDYPPQYSTGTPSQIHQQQPQPQVVMVQNPTPVAFGPHPMRATCPSCGQTNISKVDYTNTSKTHLIATILCITTCCCCFIPYMVNSCKSTNHLCQNCGAYLGSYDK